MCNNKKKMLIILISVILVILIIVVSSIVLKNSESEEISSINEEKVEENSNNNISSMDENIIKTSDEKATDIETNSYIEDNSTVIEIEKDNNIENTINNYQTSTNTETQNEIIYNSSTNQENSEEQKIEEVTQSIEDSVEETIENSISSNENNSTIVDSTEVDESKENVETFKINQDMIDKMIDTINENPSEYMIKYGYNIVVDSSIIKLTNQFTYTDKRIISQIAWKFGEIRVYAQDYYVNGNYVWTECYII